MTGKLLGKPTGDDVVPWAGNGKRSIPTCRTGNRKEGSQEPRRGLPDRAVASLEECSQPVVGRAPEE